MINILCKRKPYHMPAITDGWFLARSMSSLSVTPSQCCSILWCCTWWTRWNLRYCDWVYGQWFFKASSTKEGQVQISYTYAMSTESLNHIWEVWSSWNRTLDRRKRLLIAMDAAFGMEYLHGKNVVHFDIKCENLLVNMRDIQRPICKVVFLTLFLFLSYGKMIAVTMSDITH